MSYIDCIYYHKVSNRIYVDVDELNKQFNEGKGTILTFILDNQITFSYLSDIQFNDRKFISYTKLFNVYNNFFEISKFNIKQQNIIGQLLDIMQKISIGEIKLTDNGDELMLANNPNLS